MGPEYEKLVQQLLCEKKLYRELLELFPGKKKAIIENDVDALNFIVASEKNIADEVFQVANRRNRCLSAIGRALNLGTNPTLQQIIKEAPENLSEIKKLRIELRRLGIQLKANNVTSNLLIQDQLNLIVSYKSALFDGQTNYGMDGKDVVKNQSLNLLDRMV